MSIDDVLTLLLLVIAAVELGIHIGGRRRYEKAIGVASPAAQLLSAGSGCHNGL